MKIKLLFLALALPMFMMAQDIILPQPDMNMKTTLGEALQKRKSTRSYTQQELDLQQISNVLWAAWGYNREDKRTAPSSQNKQELDLYVVLKSGIYGYDAKNNRLVLINKGDYMSATGKQDFAATAPLNIVIVADKNRMAPADDNRQLATASINAGYISENIYLYCAATGLGTVARGSFDAKVLTTLLSLKDNQMIILCQTVGYPKF